MHLSTQSEEKNRIIPYLIFAIWLLVLLLNNGSISLWDEDESAYALFGKRMLETGDWINPDFEWSFIHRKTPFHFWAVGLSFGIFGANEWALRLPSLLAIFGTGCYLYRWLLRNGGFEWAWRALLIFSVGLFSNSLAKVSLTDAGLLFFSCLAMGSLWDYLKTEKWAYSGLFWSAIAAGMLVKGPPIVILTGGLYLFCIVFASNRQILFRWYQFLFGILSLLPFVGWAYASYLQDGGIFLQFLYDWYVVKRVGGSVLGQTGWAGYHFAVLSVSFLAFLPFVWGFIPKWKAFSRENGFFSVYLLGCLLFGWVFYELMSSKLPSYSIAAQPIVAVLAAWGLWRWETDREARGQKWAWAAYFLLWALLCAGLFFNGLIKEKILELVSGELQILAVLLFAELLLVAVLLARGRQTGSVWAMAGLGWSLQIAAWGWIVPILEQTPFKSLDNIAQIANAAALNQPVHLVGIGTKQTKPSLLFYLQQPYDLGQGKHFVESSSEVFLQQLATNQPVVGILGTDAQALSDSLAQAQGLEVRRLDWWSSDDQLKNHPFVLVSKK